MDRSATLTCGNVAGWRGPQARHWNSDEASHWVTHRRPGPSRGTRRPCSAPHRRRRASGRGGMVRIRRPGCL